jgi:hypothetical protein
MEKDNRAHFVLGPDIEDLLVGIEGRKDVRRDELVD